MNLVQTQEGAEYVWKVVLGAVGGPGLKVHLFGSPHTPSHTDTYATLLAAELAVAGYAAAGAGAGADGVDDHSNRPGRPGHQSAGAVGFRRPLLGLRRLDGAIRDGL